MYRTGYHRVKHKPALERQPLFLLLYCGIIVLLFCLLNGFYNKLKGTLLRRERLYHVIRTGGGGVPFRMYTASPSRNPEQSLFAFALASNCNNCVVLRHSLPDNRICLLWASTQLKTSDIFQAFNKRLALLWHLTTWTELPLWSQPLQYKALVDYLDYIM